MHKARIIAITMMLLLVAFSNVVLAGPQLVMAEAEDSSDLFFTSLNGASCEMQPSIVEFEQTSIVTIGMQGWNEPDEYCPGCADIGYSVTSAIDCFRVSKLSNYKTGEHKRNAYENLN